MKLKIFLILIIGLIIPNLDAPLASCLFSKCGQYSNSFLNKSKKNNHSLPKKNYLLSAYKNQVIDKKNINLETVFKEENIQLRRIFNNLLISENQINEKKEDKLSYEIEADKQYVKDEIFYAEGNVSISLPYGVFKADKISFDKKNRILKVFENINFINGGQYLTASYLDYDFNSGKGIVKDVYGILDFKTLGKDFNYTFVELDEKKCPLNDNNLIDLPSEVELLSSSNLRLRNSLGLNAFSFDFASITKWRFKTEEILLDNKKWKSKLIYFTNDPFNQPQLILKSKDFKAEIISGKTIFKSGSTSLEFDNKFVLPLGKRSITDGGASSRWGLGYETNEKDGLYLIRSFDPIDFGNNFELNLQPYFLLQRAISGKSNSFREKGSSLATENISTKVDSLDYLAMNAKLTGSIFDFSLTADTDIKTLNPDKFYDGFSGELNLIKNLYSFQKLEDEISDNVCSVKPSNGKLVNHDIDFGLYSQFDQNDVYLSYGAKILNEYNLQEKNINKNFSLIFDYGQFKGKGQNMDNNEKLIDLSRSGLNISLSYDYKIADLNNNNENFSKDNRNSSNLIDQGIYLNGKIAYGAYFYGNGTNQNISSFSLGPTLTYGKLKRNFLDFTQLSLSPEFIMKDGESPFKFDDFNNDSRIRFNLKQQLYGPLIFGFEGSYNINNNSSLYGDIQNKTYSLGISRRAYSINLNYEENNKAVFLGFKIFNFDFQNSNKSF